MGSSLHQWELDPLFPAAEVVQDSADRMESIFRLLLHEQSLIQEHPDSKLLTSIEYHKRDLATTLETAKWQLEDFEREVNLSAMIDKSQARENVIYSHKQFIRAIREQTIHVEKSLEDTSVGDSVRSHDRLNLNEQDRDGLALFLSGGNSTQHVAHHDADDSNLMRRFFDPTTSSKFNEEIVEHDNRETENAQMNGFVHMNHSSNSKEYKLRKVGSHYSTQVACEERGANSWDLEANEDKVKSCCTHNKLKGYFRTRNVSGLLGNLWSAYGSRASRSFMKRWKDGEDQSDSPAFIDASHSSQGDLTRPRLGSRYSSFQRYPLGLSARGDLTRPRLGSRYSSFQGYPLGLSARVMQLVSWLGQLKMRHQRYLYIIQVHRHSIRLISAILVAVIVLGILVYKVY